MSDSKSIGEILADLGDFEPDAARRRAAAADVERVDHAAHEAIANASRARRAETVNRKRPLGIQGSRGHLGPWKKP